MVAEEARQLADKERSEEEANARAERDEIKLGTFHELTRSLNPKP